MAQRIALTGATGFIGQHLHAILIARGYSVQALARTPQAAKPNTHWVMGDLRNPAALAALVEGVSGVIHLAGVIKGRSWAQFQRGNVEATQALLQACEQSGVPHFLHVSTLAARVADISLYAKSKALAEQCVKAGKVAWTIVRLPAIYGPGDRETLAFFKAARGYWLPLSNPSGLLTLLHVHDACMAIVAALEPAAMGECYEVGDEQPITVAALAQAISQAVGGRAIACPIPRMLASGVAWANLAISYLVQREPMFTPAKVRELYHSDWSVCDKRLGALTGWQPTIPLVQGLNETSAWYQAQGWL